MPGYLAGNREKPPLPRFGPSTDRTRQRGNGIDVQHQTEDHGHNDNTVDTYRQLLLEANADEHVEPGLVERLLTRRRRAVRNRRTVQGVALLAAVGAAIFAYAEVGSTTDTSRVRPAAPPSSLPTTESSPLPKSYGPARLDHVDLPPGYALFKSERSPIPTGTSAKITSVDLRYEVGGTLPQGRHGGPGQLSITLQTGDVTPPDLTTLKSGEPTAHYADLRPGVQVIFARDAAATGGLSYYMWFEQGVYVEVTALGGTVPDLAQVVASLRFSP